MLTHKKKAKNWRTLAIVVLFIAVLTGSRILWISYFYDEDQPQAVNGQLDLRYWDMGQEQTINLDGEWEFYPQQLVMDQHRDTQLTNDQFIQVPGGWNESLEPGKKTPYGYGSYRLQILVNPEQDYTYSIHVPSVRSSSELYVNGRLLAGSGQPSTNEQDYIAKNIPYTASFTAYGSRVIEVVVQAANYKDYRDSGLIRSLRFGTEAAIAKETEVSAAIQQMVAVVFLVHAIYAVILYVLGSRDKKLLYFSLLMLSVMLMNVVGAEEKILHSWFLISYEWGFRLVHLSMIGISTALFMYAKEHISPFWKKLHSILLAICVIGALIALFMPMTRLFEIQSFYFGLMCISIIMSIWTLMGTVMRQFMNSIRLMLAFIALVSSLIWGVIMMASGIKIIFYPFDLILVTALCASEWFEGYFREHLKMKKLTAKLQRADKLKDEFLANTSHELSGPLHMILNLSQSILEREQRSIQDKSVKDLENILYVGRRMSSMLSELLDVMSLKQSVPKLQLTRVELRSIVTGVLDMLYSMSEGKQVQLKNEIPEHFPSVLADENRMIQAIYHLIHNAVKFTNEGEVSVSGYVEDHQAYLVITDTGIGMDENTLRCAFESYEQADYRQRMVEGGFGLGLSISKQLIELHGGELQISSIPGRGTKLTFGLQVIDTIAALEDTGLVIEAETAAAADKIESRIPGPPSEHILITSQQTPSPAGRLRVMLVDDDPIILSMLQSILSDMKYDMTAVTGGEQALAAIDQKEWDLIISDVMMPLMSGYELTRRIRQRFTLTELPVLLMTARRQPEDIDNAFLAGANDYVIKPVDALELQSRVRALTDVKQSVRERLNMETAWLQAQIQPHFLFNTLNAISALSEIDLEKMRDLLQVLSNFLRDKFQFQQMDDFVPIQDELSIVRSYLYIEQVRFGDRLQVAWEIDEGVACSIPLLTIQPLVENAVKHGIMKRASGGKLTIRIVNHEAYAEISIIDDGIGISEEITRQLLDRTLNQERGVGLINTDLRLKRHFGKGLVIKSSLDQGTTISFIVHKQMT